MKRTLLSLSATMALFLALVRALVAQPPAPASPQPPPVTQQVVPEKDADEGIAISDRSIRQACGPCHKADPRGRMSRISFRRTTPEGWQETVRRMVALNDLVIEPQTARAVVKYLSNHLGLAPEEARPAAFEVERRMIDFKYSDKDTETACTKCHSMGRVISERRTKEEWELLLAMHRGFYPLVDFQAFRRMGSIQTEPGPDGRPPDNRHPMEKAVAHLSSAFPLKTPEWSAWAANMRAPRIAGVWTLSGHQLGKGAVYGRVVISSAPAAGATDGGSGEPDEFVTEIRYTYARGGQSVARTGKAVVYTGFQWRGRSTESGTSARDVQQVQDYREVMFIERDGRQMSGRWFTGAYDETGLDIKLQRVGADPIVLGVQPTSIKAGTSGLEVRIFGANLPASLRPGDVDLGRGVSVRRVVRAAPDEAVIEVDVSADENIAPVGLRDLFVGGHAREGAVAIYDRIDAIRVAPQAGMARVGGANFPKQLQQFEATAYHNGPDAKPGTKDDVALGIVDVAWSLEEYTAVFGDDDRLYVGTIGADGLFTPNEDGPNPKRRNNANNIGDVWVVATFLDRDASSAKPLRARAHLLVTVPLYMRWDLSPIGY